MLITYWCPKCELLDLHRHRHPVWRTLHRLLRRLR